MRIFSETKNMKYFELLGPVKKKPVKSTYLKKPTLEKKYALGIIKQKVVVESKISSAKSKLDPRFVKTFEILMWVVKENPSLSLEDIISTTIRKLSQIGVAKLKGKGFSEFSI